jgi:hypothetical protein
VPEPTIFPRTFCQCPLRIGDILLRIRIHGFVPPTNVPDPTPDPAIFVIDLQDANKKLIFSPKFSAFYFLKVHLHLF